MRFGNQFFLPCAVIVTVSWLFVLAGCSSEDIANEAPAPTLTPDAVVTEEVANQPEEPTPGPTVKTGQTATPPPEKTPEASATPPREATSSQSNEK